MVRAYVNQHHADFFDLDDGKYPDLNNAEFHHFPGFLRTQRGAAWLILSPTRWTSEFGSRSKALLDELASDGLLWATEGNQRQLKVRQSKPKDRVYCIKID